MHRHHCPRRAQLQQLEPRILLSRLSYSTATVFDTNRGVRSMVSADFNRDGKTDLAALNNFDDNFSVLLNAGAGVFSPKTDYVTGHNPWTIATADFNGDGFADLAVTNRGSTAATSSVSVYLNNGNGTFAPPVNYATNISPIFVLAADFNNDAHPDLLVSTASTISVFLNNGNGTFAAKIDYSGGATYAATLADLNADGFVDLAVGGTGGIFIRFNNQSGGFPASVSYAGGFITSLVAADLNGDGALDLAGTQYKDDAAIFLNNGNGTFATEVEYPDGPINIAGADAGITAADFNADGRIDIAVSNNTGLADSAISISVLLNTGNAAFAAPISYSTWAFPTPIIATDLNGDFRADLAIGTAFNVDILLNTGDSTGNFVRPQRLATGVHPIRLISGDFNNDGLPDLISSNSNSTAPTSYSFSLLLNAGNGNFANKIDYPTTSAGASAAADFNTDGKLDLAITAGSNLSIYLNQGASLFGPHSDYAIGSASNLAVADFNNDTKPDIALTDVTSNVIRVLINNGNGTFAPAVPYAAGTSPFDIAAADFNGDGYADIVIGNLDSKNVMFFYNNGNGTFANGVAAYTTTGQALVASADLNADNKPDLLVCDSPNLRVYINAGSGNFAAPVTYAVGPASYLRTADYDGDGKPDVSVWDTFNKFSIFLNNGNGSLNTTALGFVTLDGRPARADFNGDGKPDLAFVNAASNAIDVILNTTDSSPPTINSLYVSSTSWSAQFLTYLASTNQGSAAYGYKIPAGSTQPLPWPNLNRISIEFSENVAPTQAALALAGLNVPSYSISNFLYNATTRTATWTLASPIAADAINLSIPAASLTDTSGNALAASYHATLNVLPGDANQDGRIDGADFDLWFTHLQNQTFSPGDGDINADGRVDGADFDIWFTHLQNTLPTAASLNLVSSNLVSALSPQDPELDTQLSTSRKKLKTRHPGISATRLRHPLLSVSHH